MIMASIQLLARNPKPTREEVAEGLVGNLCRCTGYSHIIDAVQHAAAAPEVTRG
jgi:carbon-monoxide dehydrogenase small subunit